MSQFDKLMEQLEEIKTQNAWLVKAVKHLLEKQAGVTPSPLSVWVEDEDDLDLDDESEDWIAPRFAPKAPKAKPCPHNQQGVVDGRLICLRCGYAFGDSGVVQSRLSNDGRVIADPNPPEWSTQHSPGASSKNPGTPLVPHSS